MGIKKLMHRFWFYYKHGAIMPVLFGIVIRILYLPGIRRWFGEIVKAYEIDSIRREEVLSRKKQKGLLKANFRHYLPKTEERIERLRALINKRPVAIILHGPSLFELEKNIGELKDCDICYLGLNSFSVPEKNILQKINRNFSVVMCSDACEMHAQIINHNLTDFLEREENNILINERRSFRQQPLKSLYPNADKFIKKYDNKLLFFESLCTTNIVLRGGAFLQVPSIEYPLHFLAQSSFSILLSLALIAEAKMVVVFGGDGGRMEGEDIHYRETGLALRQYYLDSARDKYIKQDTKTLNVTLPLILDNINRIYDLKPVDIINCSLHSRYTPMRKLSYKDTFSILKSFK